jgi:1-acyl-sn-glycerol-3-phosphate acyltransferase
MLLAHYPVKVVPVAIHGTYELMPTGRPLPKPGPVQIEFGTPVDADTLAGEGDGDEQRERIVSGLARRLGSMVEPKVQ